MFSTSHDILLLTIAACVAAFTFFACWGLFYLVAMIRNVYGITKDFKNLFKKIEDLIDVLKNKVHESSTYFLLFGEVLKKVMDIAHSFGNRRRDKNESDDAGDKCDCEECAAEEAKEETKPSEKAKKVKVREK
jgi:hypothetical protein